MIMLNSYIIYFSEFGVEDLIDVSVMQSQYYDWKHEAMLDRVSGEQAREFELSNSITAMLLKASQQQKPNAEVYLFYSSSSGNKIRKNFQKFKRQVMLHGYKIY